MLQHNKVFRVWINMRVLSPPGGDECRAGITSAQSSSSWLESCGQLTVERGAPPPRLIFPPIPSPSYPFSLAEVGSSSDRRDLGVDCVAPPKMTWSLSTYPPAVVRPCNATRHHPLSTSYPSSVRLLLLLDRWWWCWWWLRGAVIGRENDNFSSEDARPTIWGPWVFSTPTCLVSSAQCQLDSLWLCTAVAVRYKNHTKIIHLT